MSSNPSPSNQRGPEQPQDLAAAIAPHRENIDRLDAELLALLSKRAAEARAIGALKGTAAVYRPEREAQVLARIAALNDERGGPLHEAAVRRIFREIMSECLALEKPLTVAYLGPRGTFTEAAAARHFGGAALLVPQPTLDEALREVEARQADYAVLPVENSTEGAVGRTLDLLLATPLRACGEVTLRIHHCLLSLSAPAEVRQVYAHAQALAQCQDYLRAHFPRAERLAVSSNAEAARLAAAAGASAGVAAIAPLGAADIYGLSVLERNIEDDPSNTTRFLVLGAQSPAPSGRDRTTLAVAAPQAGKAGAMHRLLEPFSTHNVSMTRLESRPVRGGLWQYVFFIDIEGHEADPHVSSALEEMRGRANFLKVVGSYPVA